MRYVILAAAIIALLDPGIASAVTLIITPDVLAGLAVADRLNRNRP